MTDSPWTLWPVVMPWSTQVLYVWWRPVVVGVPGVRLMNREGVEAIHGD